jgi:hypothetical protein
LLTFQKKILATIKLKAISCYNFKLFNDPQGIHGAAPGGLVAVLAQGLDGDLMRAQILGQSGGVRIDLAEVDLAELTLAQLLKEVQA